MDKFWSFRYIKWHQIIVCNLLNFKTLDGCADIYPVWFINVILVFSLTTFLEPTSFWVCNKWNSWFREVWKYWSTGIKPEAESLLWFVEFSGNDNNHYLTLCVGERLSRRMEQYDFARLVKDVRSGGFQMKKKDEGSKFEKIWSIKLG